MYRIIFVSVFALFISACSSTASFNRYLITSDVQNYDLDNKYDVSLSMATHLDCNGIVMQTSDVSFVEAINNKWAEPISIQISAIIEDRLIQEQLSDKLKYKFYISKFNGRTDGTVHTSIQISIDKQKKHIFDYKRVISREMSGDGYESLVNDLRMDLEVLLDDFISKFKKEVK